ncbi:MAG TPA: hypothetical protein VL500_05690 [Candidatus Eisenbacteria bacterium]|nr:hypothetical protein [Candidatus Eisenbacteria bacterium]
MKKALRVVAAVPAVVVLIAAVPLSYYGLATLFASVLLSDHVAAQRAYLLVFAGPACLFAGFLALRALYPAQFR